MTEATKSAPLVPPADANDQLAIAGNSNHFKAAVAWMEAGRPMPMPPLVREGIVNAERYIADHRVLEVFGFPPEPRYSREEHQAWLDRGGLNGGGPPPEPVGPDFEGDTVGPTYAMAGFGILLLPAEFRQLFKLAAADDDAALVKLAWDLAERSRVCFPADTRPTVPDSVATHGDAVRWALAGGYLAEIARRLVAAYERAMATV